MKTGLFFGSFNPVHIGHMAIANYMAEFTDLDEVWFIVTPHSPFKKKHTLLDNYQRLELLNRAIADDTKMRVSDIEFRLPVPSYTIDTLTYLSEKYPEHDFVLIMGADGLPMFHKWKNAEEISQRYERYIYPRPGFLPPYPDFTNCKIVDAPQMDISASFIRNAIKEKKNVRHFLPKVVFEYLDEMNFYR